MVAYFQVMLQLGHFELRESQAWAEGMWVASLLSPVEMLELLHRQRRQALGGHLWIQAHQALDQLGLGLWDPVAADVAMWRYDASPTVSALGCQC